MANPSGNSSRNSGLGSGDQFWIGPYASHSPGLRGGENMHSTASLNQCRTPNVPPALTPVSNVDRLDWSESSSTAFSPPTGSGIPHQVQSTSVQTNHASVPQASRQSFNVSSPQVPIGSTPFRNGHRSVNVNTTRGSFPVEMLDERPMMGLGNRGGSPASMYFTPSIFYNVKQAILPHKSLFHTSDNMVDTCRARKSESLNVPVGNLYRNRDDPCPRYELQMRMTSFDGAGEQLDQFPEGLKVLINGREVTLPPFVGVSQSAPAHGNTKEKRASQPIDLTLCCDFKNNTQKLTIEWNVKESKKKRYVFGIWVVEHVNSEILCDRLLNSRMKRMIIETQTLISKSYQDSGVIDIDNQKVSLVCPITHEPMKFPCYSRNCNHFQCFDVLNFLKRNEEQPSWKCPICTGSVTYESLILDEYFAQIINDMGGRVREVELLPNGKWEVSADRKRGAVESINNNDEHPMKKSGAYSVGRNNENQEDTSKGSNKGQPNVVQNTFGEPRPIEEQPVLSRDSSQVPIEVITLGDSDDD